MLRDHSLWFSRSMHEPHVTGTQPVAAIGAHERRLGTGIAGAPPAAAGSAPVIVPVAASSAVVAASAATAADSAATARSTTPRSGVAGSTAAIGGRRSRAAFSNAIAGGSGIAIRESARATHSDDGPARAAAPTAGDDHPVSQGEATDPNVRGTATPLAPLKEPRGTAVEAANPGAPLCSHDHNDHLQGGDN